MIEIIPVIDIKEGNAVKAYKGEREKYKELKHRVVDIVEKYCASKFEHIYIADLDAIMNKDCENFALIGQIATMVANNKINLMVDFGIHTFEEYKATREKIRNENVNLIVGTETYTCNKFPDDAIVSIDAVDGEILGGNFDNVIRFLNNNCNLFVVIDLKRIGTSKMNVELCERVFKAVGRKFIYGGGVRLNEIHSLWKYCNGVLVGTEIYEKLNL